MRIQYCVAIVNLRTAIANLNFLYKKKVKKFEEKIIQTGFQ